MGTSGKVLRVTLQRTGNHLVKESVVILTSLLVTSGYPTLQLHADLSVYPKFWGR